MPDTDPDHRLEPPAYEDPEIERPASAAPTERELEEEVPGGSAVRHDPYAALRFRDYQLFSIGGMIATMGTQMQSVAIGWELYERTGHPAALGYVGLVQALPVIALALPAGHIADRFERRTVVLIGLVFLALASLGLALLSARQGPIPLYYLCLFLGGVAHACSDPARSALITQLVPEELLANAITWNSSRWQIASVLGPAMGGIAIAIWHGAFQVYVIDAMGSVVLFFFIFAIRGRKQQKETRAVSLASLMAGIKFVRGTKLILATITLDMFAVLLGGATTLLPVYAKDILHVGPSGLGWLRAAPAIGAVVMALSLTHLPPMRHAGKSLLWAVGGFGVATIVFGLSRNFLLSVFMLILTGAFDNISVVVRHTLVQVLTPDQMRGRVSAVNNVFIGTSNEMGSFESGQVAQWFGPIFSVVFGGIGTILVVLGIASIWPEVKRLGTLESASVGAGTSGSGD